MSKKFSGNIVASVFGKSFDSIDIEPIDVPSPVAMGASNAQEAKPSSTERYQLSVILAADDYDKVWEEVTRRRKDRRARRIRGQYGPSHLIAEYVEKFLAADAASRQRYYDGDTKGNVCERVGLRFPLPLRDLMEDECARLRSAGMRRTKATTTAVIIAAIHMGLESSPTAVATESDDFSSGLVF